MPRASSAAFIVISVRVLGVAAIMWGGLVLPSIWQQGPLGKLAAEILEGQVFRRQALLAQDRRLEAVERSLLCNPVEMHNAVIVRLAMFEGAIRDGNQAGAESAYSALHDAATNALACVPSDAFAWLALFWLDVGRRGLSAANAEYLRLSYALAPNEGWIALWRNRLALSMFEQLPADLSDDALEEFVRLVDTGRLYSETATIFAKAGLSAKNRIVERLAKADATSRALFARTLYDMGLDVEIPNTTIPGLRSWEK
jgi:hypothetical protein